MNIIKQTLNNKRVRAFVKLLKHSYLLVIAFGLIVIQGEKCNIAPEALKGAVCGDGVIQGATPSTVFKETCDDGNDVSGDGCSADCQLEPAFCTSDASSDGKYLCLSVKNTEKDSALTGKARTISFRDSTVYFNKDEIQPTTEQQPFINWSKTKQTENTYYEYTCTGKDCTITIKPGSKASQSRVTSTTGEVRSCDTAASQPRPSIIEIINNQSSQRTTYYVYVLDYGCIVEGGNLFYVDNAPTPENSIKGKVVRDASQENGTAWATENSTTGATSLVDGSVNRDTLIQMDGTLSSFPAAKICSEIETTLPPSSTVSDKGDWYLPAICEMTSRTTEVSEITCNTTQTTGKLMWRMFTVNREIKVVGRNKLRFWYWSGTEAVTKHTTQTFAVIPTQAQGVMEVMAAISLNKVSGKAATSTGEVQTPIGVLCRKSI